MVIRVKESKYYQKKLKKKLHPNYSNTLNKILLTIIVVLISLITCNLSSNLKEKYQTYFLENNLNFNSIRQISKKIFGQITEEEEEVSNEIPTIETKQIEQKEHYAIIEYTSYEPVQALKPGIIVYIGEKDGLEDTIIVQGNDGINIWYSHVLSDSLSLYDYVKEGDTLGTCTDNNLLLTILDKEEYLTYEEYFQN